MDQSNSQHDIDALLLRMTEGDLDDAESRILLEWSRNTPDALERYCHFMLDYAMIRSQVSGRIEYDYDSSTSSLFRAIWSGNKAPFSMQDGESSPDRCGLFFPEDTIQDGNLRDVVEREWEEHILEEKKAQGDTLAVKKPPLERKPVPAHVLYQFVSKWAVVGAVCLAIIWLDRELWRRSQTMPAMPVAQLTQLIGVLESESTGHHYYSGEAVYSEVCVLEKDGLVELIFPSQVKAVVEGPARFEIPGFNQVHLLEGKLFARVPTEGIGFTVNSPSARIVDLGTEFGLEVWEDGVTDVYTYDGQVQVAGSASRNPQENIIVSANEAKRVDGSGQTIHHLEFHERKFAREIDARNEFVWRGQGINLADIVGGGNGFGTGTIGHSIDPLTGQAVLNNTNQYRQGDGRFQMVPSINGVDGVFVPDGGSGGIQITSAGHLFQDCPNTSNWFYSNIAYGGQLSTDMTKRYLPLMLEGKVYGTRESSAIILHSNVGVTFDLNVFRRWFPEKSVKSFRSAFGISQKMPGNGGSPVVDFWILVDGDMRVQREGLRIEDGSVDIDIALEPSDRFLTLIVTDGVKGDDDSIGPIGNDYAFLGNPVLELTR